MPLRHQLPVSSPIRASALLRAGMVAVGAGEPAAARVRAALAARYGARAVALTDSGTAALVLALGIAVRPGATVALPAYACVDLIAAAVRARLRVRLYDIDPRTLGPDLDSLRRALGRGAQVVVVAHLYGYAADIPSVRALADAAGAYVIEDAAQHAGGRLGGLVLGTFGPLTVLSFGRGKGTTGGRGGALLATRGADEATVARVADWAAHVGGAGETARAPVGVGDLGRAVAQWALGRPAVYGVPASMPGLRLGETVYRAAHEPHSLSRAAAALVEFSLARMDADRAARAHRAQWYVERLARSSPVRLVQPIAGAEPGFLRLPVLTASSGGGYLAAAPVLGIVRTYPRPLGEEPAIAAVLCAREPATPGAREICSSLLTLPTHDGVTDADAEKVMQWAVRQSPLPISSGQDR
jgi:perosamine synthetase